MVCPIASASYYGLGTAAWLYHGSGAGVVVSVRSRLEKTEALELLHAAALCTILSSRPLFLKSSGRAESGKAGDAFCWEHNAVIICRDGHRSLRPSLL